MSDNEQKKIFKKNLLRYLGNIPQTEVAKAIGVSPQTFNTWCQGIAIPRIGKMQKLADYFGINLSDLIEDKPITLPEAPALELSDDEEKLVRDYRELDPTDKGRVLGTVSTLLSAEKYQLLEKNA